MAQMTRILLVVFFLWLAVLNLGIWTGPTWVLGLLCAGIAIALILKPDEPR